MKKITRKAFTEYLGNLPPNEPFCKGNNCPLRQFYFDTHPEQVLIDVGANSYGTENYAIKTPLWMFAFVDMVDNRRTGFWEEVTPGQCMEDLKYVSKYY